MSSTETGPRNQPRTWKVAEWWLSTAVRGIAATLRCCTARHSRGRQNMRSPAYRMTSTNALINAIAIARIPVARLENARHLVRAEWERRLQPALRCLYGERRISPYPLGLLAETEERPQAFQVLGGVVHSVRPRRAKLAELIDADLLEEAIALGVTPREKTTVQEVLVLPGRLPADVTSSGVREELLYRLDDGGDLRLDDADFARLVPLGDQVAGRGPRREVERLLDGLAAERAFDVDRTRAATVTFRSLTARSPMPAVEPKHKGIVRLRNPQIGPSANGEIRNLLGISYLGLAERVGFVPVDDLSFNNLGLNSIARNSKNTQNSGSRYKTGTVNRGWETHPRVDRIGASTWPSLRRSLAPGLRLSLLRRQHFFKPTEYCFLVQRPFQCKSVNRH